MSAARWIPACAIGAGALAATTCALKVATWYWPWHRDAWLNETALFVAAFAVPLAAVVAVRPRRLQLSHAAMAAAVGGTLYVAGSFAGLAIVGAEAPGFGRYRTYVFSGADCEFTARFPRPPDSSRHAGTGGDAGNVDVAMLVEVGQLTTMTAECASGSPARDAKAALLVWASSAGVIVAEIMDVPNRDAPVIRLRGHLPGSVMGPDDRHRARTTAVESLLYNGRRSTLRLTATRADGEPMNSETMSFLNSGHRK